MKIHDARPAPKRRAFAGAVTVIVALAVVSLALEWRSGSDLGEIAYSFATFGVILSVAVVRFFVRSGDRDSREKLWITALWTAVIDLVARLLPGGPAVPPEGSAAESSPSVPPPGRPTGDDGVRRGTDD
jgi:hypothetical protein